MTAQEYLVCKFKRAEAAAKEELDKFQLKLAENPLYAFSWSESAFDAAAQYAVFHDLNAEMSEEGFSLEKCAVRLQDMLLVANLFPSRSSSAQHNLSEASKFKSLAEAYRIICDTLKQDEELKK